METNKKVAVLQIIRQESDNDTNEYSRVLSHNRNAFINFHISIPYVAVYNSYQGVYNVQKISEETLRNYNIAKQLEFSISTQKFNASSQKKGGNFYANEELSYLVSNLKKGNFETELIDKTSKSKKSEANLVYESAERMTNIFNLETVSDYLFSLEGKIDLIKIFTNDIYLPWDWIYNAGNGKPRILAEVFGVGVTKANETASEKRDHEPLTRLQLHKEEHCALIIANDYLDDQENYLKNLNYELEPIVKEIKEAFGTNSTFYLRNPTLLDLKNILRSKRESLKLIYMVGHFKGRKGFLLAEGGEIDYAALKRMLGVRGLEDFFSNHPVVILNGCTTTIAGNAPSPNDPNIQIPIAQGMLDLGACACIVTSLDVKLNYAVPFSKHFIHYLFTPGLTVGEVLKNTRLELAKLDCYEWASYHLHGDPSYMLIRKEFANTG